jgi:hypothetical protein
MESSAGSTSDVWRLVFSDGSLLKLTGRPK